MDITFEQGVPDTLQLNPDYTYEWSPSGIIPDCFEDCSEVIINLEQTEEFTVTITSAEGCTSEEVVEFKVFPMCSVDNIHLPNAFTPNGDNVSDKFGLLIPEEHLEVIKSIEIFDRWGQKVYEGSGMDACWDGTFKGNDLPAEVYMYIIVVGCERRDDQIIHGDLTLIR